jgi:hypothetical protein
MTPNRHNMIRRILKRVRSNFFRFLKLNRIVFIISKIAVLFQNPFKQFVTIHGRHFGAGLKLLYQIKQVFADLCKGFSRFGWFDSGKASEIIFGKIFIDNFFIDGVELVLIAPFQIYQKLVNALGKDGDSTQPPHIGFDMHRVDPLFVDFNVENLRQPVCAGLENIVLKIVFRNNLSIIP